MSTTQNDVTNALTSAIQTIAESKVQSKEATLVIEAEIVEVIDEGLGTYKIKYLGNQFEATTAHTEVAYQIGDMVYVVVPNGDFDKNKVILSPVAPNAGGYAYSSSNSSDVSYINIGDNLFRNVNNINLSTWRPQEASYSTRLNDEAGFEALFNAALQDSRSFNFTCKIQTNIEKERRSKGNYGLVLSLPVRKNVDGKDVREKFEVVLDINNIIGDPYNLEVPALQNIYFTFPDNVVLDLSSGWYYKDFYVSPFVKDFIGEDALKPDDIFITDIQLLSVLELSEENMSGYCSIITATNGNSFLYGRTGDIKTLSVTPYLKGKVIKANNFDCYWFKENISINPANEKYHRYGERGWEILNAVSEKNILEDGKTDYQYITNNYTQIVKQEDIHCDTRFKCVLIKDTVKIISYITIKNLAANATIELSSVNGQTTFSKGMGNIELQLKYSEPEITDDLYPKCTIKYAWARYDKRGNFIDDNFYNIDNLNDWVTEGQQGHEGYKQYYYTKISFPASLVDEQNTIACTVYIESPDYNYVKTQTIGTKSLVININENINGSIAVENGDKLYKYDANGDSPLNGNYGGSLSNVDQTIDPISIRIYKEDGSEFIAEEYAVTTVTWLVPINSMIELDASQKTDITSNPGYYTITGSYSNRYQLQYSIAKKYNYNKTDNTIIVKVETPSAILKEIISKTINIQFLKDGAGGTNGTQFSAIITYNGYAYEEKDSEGKVHKFQLIYVADEEQWYKYDVAEQSYVLFGSSTEIPFDYRVYKDGGIPDDTHQGYYNAEWGFFDDIYDQYDTTTKPTSPVSFTRDYYGVNGFVLNGYKMTSVEDPCGAIVELKIKTSLSSSQDAEEYIYAYYPIDCAYLAKKEYLDKFIPVINGGFTEVLYASDGTNPQYNNGKIFEILNNCYNDNINDFFAAQWYKSSPMRDLKPNEHSLTHDFNPSLKFDNGISKNYVGARIYSSEDGYNNINSQITALNREKTNIDNQIKYYTSLQNNLNIFEEYKIWYMIITNGGSYEDCRLKDTIPFYLVKTNLMKTVEQLLNQINNLSSLCKEYEDTEDGGKDPKISSLYTEVKNKINNLNRLNNFCSQLGGITNVINRVKAITPTVLTITNKIVYEESNNRSCYFTINDAIDIYNNTVNTVYATHLNSLNDNLIIEGEAAAREIISWLRDFVESVELDNLTKIYYGLQNECYRYSGIIKVLEGRISSAYTISGVYSYNAVLENIINPINETLSWYISFYENGGYTPVINDLQSQFSILENKTNKLIDIRDFMEDIGTTDSYKVGIYKPITYIYNRYEMSFINGWDGNKLELGDGYVVAPQMGAGIKDTANRFTGIVIGVKQVKEGSKGQIGLFGYNTGVQSIFLNAKDGSATFGQSGMGQIIFEPSNKQAIIKSGNYNESNKEIYVRIYPSGWRPNPAELGYYEYKYDSTQGKYNYLPTGDTYAVSGKAYYQKTTVNGGMLIDLSTPEIRFGTGNFSVTKEGHVTAKGGGTIAGWEIGDTDLYSINREGRITLHAGSNLAGDTGKIYTGSHADIDSTAAGFYLGQDGLSIAGRWYDYSAGGYRSSRFQINTAGNPKIFSGGHETLDATGKGFYIGQDGISVSNGTRSRFEISTEGDPKIFSSNHNTLDSLSNGFYLGNDGLSIGSKVYVDNTGVMRLGYGAVRGYGRHWTIDGGSDSSISYGAQGESGSVYIGTDKITLGNKFSVDNRGILQAVDAELTGEITATSGEIAGWKIDGSTLKSSNGAVKLNAEGSHSIEGNSAYIDLGGGGDFPGCHINGTKVVFSVSNIGVTRYRNDGTVFTGHTGDLTFVSGVNLDTGVVETVTIPFIHGIWVD